MLKVVGQKSPFPCTFSSFPCQFLPVCRFSPIGRGTAGAVAHKTAEMGGVFKPKVKPNFTDVGIGIIKGAFCLKDEPSVNKLNRRDSRKLFGGFIELTWAYRQSFGIFGHLVECFEMFFHFHLKLLEQHFPTRFLGGLRLPAFEIIQAMAQKNTEVGLQNRFFLTAFA